MIENFKTHDPETIQIKEAIDKVVRGIWVLAPFQRPETWKWKQQELLLDSLLQGIPIGVVYLWGFDKNKDIPCRSVPGISFERDKVHDLILDGQQRLSFLSWLKMKSIEPNFDFGPEKIYFNAKEKIFSTSSKIIEDFENGIIVVHKLFEAGYKEEVDRALYGNKNMSADEFKMISGRINSLHTALTERYIVIQRLDKSEGIGSSFNLYERVNTGGVPLNGDDYVEAGLFGVWPEGYSKIKEAVKSLSKHPEQEKESFGNIFSRSNFIRCILDELYGIPNPSSRESEPLCNLLDFSNPKYLNESGQLKRLTKTVIEKAFIKVKSAFEHLKEILVEDLYIYDGSGINPTFCIPANTFLRTQSRKLTTLKKGKFIRWFILFHIHKNVYLGSQDRKILEDCNACRLENPFSILEGLLVDRIGFVKNTEDLKFRSAFYGTPGKRKPNATVINFLYHMNLFLAINKGAKDWFRDRKLEKIKRIELEKHHIFPKGLYGVGEKSTWDHIGNIARIIKYTNGSINKQEPAYKRYIPDILIRDKKLLEDQQIPINDKNLWKKHRIKSFINKRIDLIVSESNVLLNKLNNGTWENVIIPPIVTDADLVKQEESQRLEFKETLVLMTHLGIMNKDFAFVISKEVAGFMNNGGGTLFIGIKDKIGPDRVVGLERDFELLAKGGTNPRESFQTLLDNRLKTDLKRKNFDAILSKDFVEIDGKVVYKIVIPHIGDVRIKKFRILDSNTGAIKKVWKDVLWVRRNDQTEPDEYIDENGVYVVNE